MSVISDLAELTKAVARRIDLPHIQQIYIPPPQANPKRHAEFGLVALADGSTGFFFALSGDTRTSIWQDFAPQRLIGCSPADAVDLYQSNTDTGRAMSLAVINAVSQHALRVTRYALDTTTHSMAKMAFEQADHVGMVGYFSSLARRLRARGVRVTVVEKKPALVQKDGDFEITLDPGALLSCDKILCTGSTILNNTLDDILAHCDQTATIAMIGPTASCLPDPLFARGVQVVGGSTVVDIQRLLDRLHRDQPWADAVQKYTVQSDRYPGISALLDDPYLRTTG